MKFKLDTEIPGFDCKIEYGKPLIFLGSCFSDEISKKFKYAGFDTLSNTFGTIFHPIALAQNIQKSLNDSIDFPVFEINDSFFSWDCSTTVSANSKEELEILLIEKQKTLKDYILNASHIFITLGSSFGYRLVSNNNLVANCHKQKQNFFQKELTTVEEMEKLWVETLDLIYKVNPKINIVFTVSPVRHSKDGLVENNRSKARLIELISFLESKFPVSYFPSYEIVLDELRDYRFFKEDMIHPNQLAIDFIWEKIEGSFFDSETQKVIAKVFELRKLSAHIVQTNNLSERQKFEENRQSKIQNFIEKNSVIHW